MRSRFHFDTHSANSIRAMISLSEPRFYIYRKLRGRYIRLLRLSPKRTSRTLAQKKLIADIEHFSLEDPNLPPYEPVSYAWAGYDPSSVTEEWDHEYSDHDMYLNADALDQTIRIGTRERLPISKSLLIALPYLHEVSETRYLWIDQLCINQKDDDERSQQVAIMYEIYGSGKRTLFWLGEEKYWTNFLHTAIAEFSGVPSSSNVRWKLHDLDAEIYEAERQIRQLDRDMMFWKRCDLGLRDLFDRPWFSRLWILQEFTHSRYGAFMTGPQTFSMFDLRNVYQGRDPSFTIFSVFRDLIRTTLAKNKLAWFLRERRTGFDSSPRCSDERDYVYALLNIVAKEPCLPAADYSLTVAQVFATATRYCFASEGTLDILALCEIRDGQRVSLDDYNHADGGTLPSWALDCSYHEADEQLDLPTTLHDGPTSPSPFNACAGRPYLPPNNIPWNQLHLKGKIIDTISWLPLLPSYPHLRLGNVDGGLGHVIASLNEREDCEDRAEKRPALIGSLVNMIIDGVLRTRVAESLTFSDVIRTLTDEDLAALFTNALYTLTEQQKRIRRALLVPVVHRRFVETSTPSLALVPQDARVGDAIAIVHGCSTPIVIRKIDGATIGSSGCLYRFIGCCYLENAMFGEKVTWTEEEADTLVLV